MGERVAVGMSGGVDSSVSALVLLQQGYEVVGVTCRFEDGPSTDASIADARSVCARLGVDHHVFDVSESFQRAVVQPFVDDYAAGLTPNPCVRCNATCKLPALIEAADCFGCEKVATGHYARIATLQDSGRNVVLAGLDDSKDQSYMLSRLSQDQLSRLLLPLGGLTKTAVRAVASEAGLSVADKPDSQDICFIDGSYRDFLAEHGVVDEPGVVENAQGEQVGKHQGLSRYTIGQRKGLGIAAAQPYYVIDKDVKRNRLTVGFADEALLASVVVGDLSWQSIGSLTAPLEAMVKLRYRSAPAPCIITLRDSHHASVSFLSPQPITAPGQYAVFYDGSMVIGSGMIMEVKRA